MEGAAVEIPKVYMDVNAVTSVATGKLAEDLRRAVEEIFDRKRAEAWISWVTLGELSLASERVRAQTGEWILKHVSGCFSAPERFVAYELQQLPTKGLPPPLIVEDMAAAVKGMMQRKPPMGDEWRRRFERQKLLSYYVLLKWLVDPHLRAALSSGNLPGVFRSREMGFVRQATDEALLRAIKRLRRQAKPVRADDFGRLEDGLLKSNVVITALTQESALRDCGISLTAEQEKIWGSSPTRDFVCAFVLAMASVIRIWHYYAKTSATGQLPKLPGIGDVIDPSHAIYALYTQFFVTYDDEIKRYLKALGHAGVRPAPLWAQVCYRWEDLPHRVELWNEISRLFGFEG